MAEDVATPPDLKSAVSFKEDPIASMSPLDAATELKRRETKLKAKEKDLSSLAQELQKRQANIQALEDKHGSVAAREDALKSEEKDVDAKRESNKKKEKQLKDFENNLESQRNVIAQQETELTQKKKAFEGVLQQHEETVNAHLQKIKQREEEEKEFAHRKNNLQQEYDKLEKERNAVQQVKSDVDKRAAALDAIEEEQKNKKKQQDQGDDRIRKTNKELEAKAKALETQAAQLQQRQDALITAEQNSSKRAIELQNEARVLAQRREELKDKAVEFEVRESEVKSTERAAQEKLSFAKMRQDQVDITLLEVSSRERQLQESNDKLHDVEVDLQRRETRTNATLKEVQHREALVREREEKANQKEAELNERQLFLDNREKKLNEDFQVLADRIVDTEKREHICHESDRKNAERAKTLRGNEKVLMNWMKEMEWREKILMQRELHGSPVHADITAHENTNQKAYSVAKFGRALVEVQLKRLKDQYVSTQMKTAMVELEEKNYKHKEFGENRDAGLGPADIRQADIAEETKLQSRTDELGDIVAEKSLEFARKITKSRAFDDNEDDMSQDKIKDLERFSPKEQMYVQLALYLEAVLKDEDKFVKEVLSCPLRDREKMTLETLLAKMTQWWRKMNSRALHRLLSVLEVRMQTIDDAIEVLNRVQEDRRRAIDEARAQLLQSMSKNDIATTPYVEKTSLDHVAESSVLAPVGLRTLQYADMSKPDRPVSPSAPHRISPSAPDPLTPHAHMQEGGKHVVLVDKHNATRGATPQAKKRTDVSEAENTSRPSSRAGRPALGALTPIKKRNLPMGYVDQTFTQTTTPVRFAQQEPRWGTGGNGGEDEFVFSVSFDKPPKSPYEVPLVLKPVTTEGGSSPHPSATNNKKNRSSIISRRSIRSSLSDFSASL
eukprot:PhF_6_TR27183/c0_g1_i1/m.39894